jgi:hypothetical protein
MGLKVTAKIAALLNPFGIAASMWPPRSQGEQKNHSPRDFLWQTSPAGTPLSKP